MTEHRETDEEIAAADMASEEAAPGESTGRLHQAVDDLTPLHEARERDEDIAAADMASEDVAPGESTGHLYQGD